MAAARAAIPPPRRAAGFRRWPAADPDRGVNLGEPFDARVMTGILAFDAGAHRRRAQRRPLSHQHHAALSRRPRRRQGRRAVGCRPGVAFAPGLFEVASRAPDKPTFLQRPDLGRALSDAGKEEIARRIGRSPTLVIIYGDGLSAAAINQNLPSSTARCCRRCDARDPARAALLRAPLAREDHGRDRPPDAGPGGAVRVRRTPGAGFFRFAVRPITSTSRRRGHRRRPRSELQHHPRGRVRPRRRATWPPPIERILRNKKSASLSLTAVRAP